MKKPLMILLAMAMPLAAVADGISIEPGQWRMKMTMTMSMMPQPQERTVEECIEKDTLSPEDFQDSTDDSGCTFEDFTVDGNTASWSLSCPNEAGVMGGQWTVTSHGDSVEGEGSMSMDIHGQQMGFSTTWTGERIGPCP